MIMNISDIPTRIEAGSDEKRSLVTRIGELDETPVLTLVDTVEASEAEPSKLPDPLIQALVDKLPKPDSIWSIDDRAKWLRAATMIFNLVYKLDETNKVDKIEQNPSALKSALSTLAAFNYVRMTEKKPRWPTSGHGRPPFDSLDRNYVAEVVTELAASQCCSLFV